MVASSWPSLDELDAVRNKVAEMSGADGRDVRVVVSPYRICPLGAHIDHQGGTVTAMTINMGILLGFVPSPDAQFLFFLDRPKLNFRQVILRSGQFHGEVKFRVDEVQHLQKIPEEPDWVRYPRGALYALQSKGHHLTKGITGFICGSEEHSSGLSSSAAYSDPELLRNADAVEIVEYNLLWWKEFSCVELLIKVGIAYLLALETANCKIIAPEENIELDRLIENEYLHLKNGILDQSAILLSKYGYLTWMDCKTRKYDVANFSELQKCQQSEGQATYKILLAFSGLKEPLMRNSGYNTRVSECREAAEILLDEDAYLCTAHASHAQKVTRCIDTAEEDDLDMIRSYFIPPNHSILKPNLAKRALHYFSENKRVKEGLEAWASGNLDEFGKLISASGRSSIENYECGCKEMIDLYEILLKAPGVFGARFSGAGFRGCCLALVDADLTDKAAAFVKQEYQKVQPELASKLPQDRLVLICEPGDSAHVV
ncbi:GHMP kinases C terminal [Musa troglodytarum]|uniref:GHMP kinases C terminal n=1 Tax=Musa troglodytarum TaxID=320322 RepID=A0A9E7H2G2_9LILI|nr:GHMP kinases C terminal [Musa troglodytarum]